MAIRSKQIEIMKVLFAHGAAVNGPVGAHTVFTPLQHAVITGATEDGMQLLFDNGVDLDAVSMQCMQTPLTLACRSNKTLGIAQLLISAGADVNAIDDNVAPLHRAANWGNSKAIELLIQSGADVNILSCEPFADLSDGSTPLHFPATKESLDCIKSLLEAGADPNIANSEGQTPLHRAALRSFVHVLNALLDAGSDPLHRDNNGRTPLQYLREVRRNMNFSAKQFNSITALLAAGDRSWECVPTPCRCLEAAMLSVWQAAPDELPELLKRLQNPPPNLIELYARIGDDAMKKVVQEVLRGLHRHFSGFPHLKEHLLNSIFDFGTV